MQNMPSQWLAESEHRSMLCRRTWLRENTKWLWPSLLVLCWWTCLKKFPHLYRWLLLCVWMIKAKKINIVITRLFHKMILLTPGTPMNKELVLMKSALTIRCQKLIFIATKLLTNISHFLSVNRLIILFQKVQCRHKKALSGLEKVLIKKLLTKNVS